MIRIHGGEKIHVIVFKNQYVVTIKIRRLGSLYYTDEKNNKCYKLIIY